MLRLARLRQPIGWLALGLGVLLSLGLAAMVRHRNAVIAQSAFDNAVHHAQSELLARFRLPSYGLRGLRGTFTSAGPLSRAQFRQYVASRDLPEEFPGTLGIAFVQRVQRKHQAAFLAATRADAAPGFAIRSFSDNDNDDLYVVKYIAPLAQNASALGLDQGSDPTRRRAIEQAVRSGQPTMSEGILLVQDGEPRKPGVLINEIGRASCRERV